MTLTINEFILKSTKQSKNILVIFILLNLFSVTWSQQFIDGYKGLWCTLGQYGPYGDKYSGGLGTYTAKHLPLAIYSETAKKTFFTYGGTTGSTDDHLLIMLSYYDHVTEKLARPVIVYDKKGVTDPHDNAAIQIDVDGYIWIFISGRYTARNGYIFRSDTPYDINSFSEVLNEPFNYPQPKYIKDKGFVLLMTNYGNGRELFTQRSTDGYTWTADKKLVNFGGHYQISDNTDTEVGFAFNWHKGGDVNNRTNLYYMHSTDLGDNWETINGTAITTPVTKYMNAALIKDYAALKLKVYLKDFRYDTNGYPVILYITSPNHMAGPSNPGREWCLVRWDGTQWIFSKVADAYHNYDMGSLYIDDGTYRIVAPTEPGPQQWGTGGEIVMWESDDLGLTWINVGAITSNSARNHTYVRRPVNTNPDFYAFWADGNTDAFSRSYLYFSNKYGDVFQMPYDFSDDFTAPIALADIEEVYPQIISENKSAQGYPALKALDGLTNNESRWQSRSFPKSIIIDYGEEKTFNVAELQTSDNRSYDYTVELSTDQYFDGTTAVDNSHNTSKTNPTIDKFDETVARYAKLTITGQNNKSDQYIKITEFALKGKDHNVNVISENHSQVTVYPNPVTQEVFYVKGLIPNDRIEIYSINGVLLYNEVARSEKAIIQSAGFPNGVVLIKVISGDNNYTIKAVIQQ